MRHLKVISRNTPAKAQLLDFLAQINGIVALFGAIDSVFGTTILDKAD